MSLVHPSTSRHLTASLTHAQVGGHLPSVVAAIIRGEELVWRGSVGESSGAAAPPARVQYRIGSITKTLTAVLVAQLHEAGALDYRDPISAHLSELSAVRATVHELLSHRSGLVAEPAGDWWERSGPAQWADLVTFLATDESRIAAPGKIHHYSNLGYGVLGELVARVTGRPWWESIQEHITVPLAMSETTYTPHVPHAQGYSVHPFLDCLIPEPSNDTGAMASAGQLWSTVDDLSVFAGFLMRGNDAVLGLDALIEMSTVVAASASETTFSGYGLGLRTVSGALIGHTGSMPGFTASLFVDRQAGQAAVVLANGTSGLNTERIAPELLKILSQHEPPIPQPWQPSLPPPDTVPRVLGHWFWGARPTTLTWSENKLSMSVDGAVVSRFEARPEGLIGLDGYHRGEALSYQNGEPGSEWLQCSTFIFTRTPYDPAAPVPGAG